MKNQEYQVLLRKSRNAPLEAITLTGDLLDEAKKLINSSYATTIPIREDILVIIDEEIMMKENYENKTNFWYDSISKNGEMVKLKFPQWIYGDIIFVGFKNNDLTSLSQEQEEFINNYLFE